MVKPLKPSFKATSLATITTYQSGVAQATAFRIVKKQTAQALKEYNLSCMQWFTIGTALEARDTGIRLTDLAKALDTTLAYMTTTVNILVARSVLVKHSDSKDGRTKLISVHPDYVSTCVEIEAHVRLRLRELLYSNITGGELASYIKVLYKISAIK